MCFRSCCFHRRIVRAGPLQQLAIIFWTLQRKLPRVSIIILNWWIQMKTELGQQLLSEPVDSSLWSLVIWQTQPLIRSVHCSCCGALIFMLSDSFCVWFVFSPEKTSGNGNEHTHTHIYKILNIAVFELGHEHLRWEVNKKWPNKAQVREGRRTGPIKQVEQNKRREYKTYCGSIYPSIRHIYFSLKGF